MVDHVSVTLHRTICHWIHADQWVVTVCGFYTPGPGKQLIYSEFRPLRLSQGQVGKEAICRQRWNESLHWLCLCITFFLGWRCGGAVGKSVPRVPPPSTAPGTFMHVSYLVSSVTWEGQCHQSHFCRKEHWSSIFCSRSCWLLDHQSWLFSDRLAVDK